MKSKRIRLSEKQRTFLQLVEECNRPVEIDGKMESIPYYIKYDFYWDWNFLRESDAKRWLNNLVERGFVTIRDRTFARITEAGKAALVAETRDIK
jgi:DNA modification methylase